MFVYPPVPTEILATVKATTVAVVIGHINPDGDCIHSQIAMQHLLEHLGIEVHLVNAGPFSRKEIRHFDSLFAPHVSQELYDRNPLVVMVDCSTMDRIGYLADEIEGLTILTVDHHAAGTNFSDLAYIVPESFSTTLNVMQLFKALNVPITSKVAYHILFGLATDTGFFKFIGAHRGETFEMVAELVELGASPTEIYNEMEGGNPFDSQRYLGALLLKAEPLLAGKVMLVKEDPADLSSYGVDNRPSDILYSHLLGVEGVEVVLYFKYIDSEEWEIGFRSAHFSSVNVGALAAELGGGGHVKAAGVTIKDTYENIRMLLLSRLEELLNK